MAELTLALAIFAFLGVVFILCFLLLMAMAS